MILSKRERYIVIATFAVLVLLGIDQYLLSPLLKDRDEAAAATTKVHTDLREADNIVNVQGFRAGNRWKEMTKAGLQANPSETESSTLKQLSEFAARSNLKIASLQPEQRTDKVKHFQQITFRVMATGRMESLKQFLYRVEHAKLPMRISEVTVTTLKEGVDDLSVNMAITTIYIPADQPKPADSVGGHAPAAVTTTLEARR